MDSVSDTSYWINFFTDGGIPAGDATQYAIIFSDNRITRDMLLDITKEYLKDMGITRLGDVIAILRHAKQVYNQEAREKVMKTAKIPSSQSVATTPSPRRATPASRMVNRFTATNPEAAPMSTPVAKLPPPDPPKSKRKVSVFERLGEDDSSATVAITSETKDQSSVFSRLGGKSALKRAASSTSLEDLDVLLDKTPSLPYAGILKATPSPKKAKTNIKIAVGRGSQLKMKNIVKTVSNFDDKSNIQRPEVSTTTAGVLSDFAKKDSLSLRDRLGRKSAGEAPSSTSGLKLKQRASVTSAKLIPGKGKSIQKRLGMMKRESQSSPVVTSTQKISEAKAKLKGKMASEQTKSDGGVFSRLGKKTS